MVKRAFRGVLLAGVALALVHCADDTKKVTSTGDDGGAANGGEAPSSGGSSDVGETAGAPATNGGMPGSAGEPSVDAGAGGVPSAPGGAPSTSGAPGDSGAGGELGVAGGGNCVPTDCCGEQPTCEAGWDTECSGTGAYQTCCEPATGILRDCGYASGGIEREVNVCLNDCTSKSYGTSACGACTNAQDPGCDTAWANECGEIKVYCSDVAAGYRLSCVEVDNNRTIDVECLCDPDAAISG